MKNVVVKLISNEVEIDSADIENSIEIPPKYEMGDFAFPCFALSKLQKQNPAVIAKNLVKKLKHKLPKEISEVDSNGAYLNFFLDKEILAKEILAKVKEKGFGKIYCGKGLKRLVEYSQPNTHKAFHVGHIRGTSLGESLSRIFKICGEKVIQINYSGDTGMHIAKWIWCYRKYHSEEKIKDSEAWIAQIYVDATSRLNENEKLQEEVDEINRK